MGKTSHGEVGCRYKGDKWNSEYKKDYKGSKINTDIIEYLPKKMF